MPYIIYLLISAYGKVPLRALEGWGTAAGVPLMRVPTGVYGWLAVLGAQRTVNNSTWSKKKNQHDPNGQKEEHVPIIHLVPKMDV